MLDYTKIILSKVSFDRNLFVKELEKALVCLDSKEILNLQIWLKQRYSGSYSTVIEEFFECNV